jgi:hypothetical protein
MNADGGGTQNLTHNPAPDLANLVAQAYELGRRALTSC